MFVYLFLIVLSSYRVVCDECVTYDFENDFDVMFTLSGVCASPMQMFLLGNYSSLSLESPHPLSEHFVTPGPFTSCASSIAFPMSNGGHIEVNLFLNLTLSNDVLTLFAFQAEFADRHIGTYNILQTTGTGWYTARFSVGGPANYFGHITLMGMVSANSLLLVDSFRFIPNSYEEECEIYRDENTSSSTISSTTPTTTKETESTYSTIETESPTTTTQSSSSEYTTTTTPEITTTTTENSSDESTTPPTSTTPTVPTTTQITENPTTPAPTESTTGETTETSENPSDTEPTTPPTSTMPTVTTTTQITENPTTNAPTESTTDETTQTSENPSDTEPTTSPTPTTVTTTETTTTPGTDWEYTFWNPLTITMVVLVSLIFLALIGIIFYIIGKRRANAEIPHVIFTDYEDLPKEYTVPRATSANLHIRKTNSRIPF